MMENVTLEGVVERLDRLEKVVTNINMQLSLLVKELVADSAEKSKTSEEEAKSSLYSDKSDAHIAKKIFAEIYEKMGISPDFELRPIEELHESMKQHGIRAEDNEFSRAIIEEREK
ncbi:hypothetical protein J4G08_09095 [Candidatus Poribacteria bacterium]|nr:hypothetical protein [Candidatus Poribacteria bacterium]